MTEATTNIAYICGFHARPASAFVQHASSFKSKVQIKAKGKTVDAKSILMLMSIGLLCGNEITIVADGPDEERAVRQLKELVELKDLWEWGDKLSEFRKENAQEEARLARIRAERLERLKQYTTTKKILENVGRVAFNQDELTNLISGDVIQEIYLCANQFVIPLDKKNKTYIGIGKPVAIIQSDKPVNFDKLGVKFKSVAFDGDYKKILSEAKKKAKKSAARALTEVADSKFVQEQGADSMARKERFALIMEDGVEVRNIDDFKAHFDIGSVVRDFCNGKLLTWLEDRYYDEEADAIKALSPDDCDFQKKLCEIFGQETPEEIERRIERLNRLKTFTDDKKILANVDKVAFDQEELADLLDDGADEIYLCANRFVIPLRMKNKTYIGIGEAVAILGNKNPVNFGELGIKFQNISFDDDYQRILPKTTAKSKSTVKNTTSADKSKKKNAL